MPWSTLSCQASEEFMRWVHLEKAEMFSVSELKDVAL